MASQNDEALKIIAGAVKKKQNVIYLCEPATLPKMHQLIVTTVNLSGNPADGDIYEHKTSKKWCLHFQAKLKFATAANLQWDVRETRPVVLQRDFIHYQAVGFYRREWGAQVAYRGDVEFDLTFLREDLVDQYTAMAKSMVSSGKKKESDVPAYVNYCVNRDYRAKRTHRLKLAATDAKSVVIDKLLNLKSGWKDKRELEVPFVVVRCQMAPDLSDPDTQRELTKMTLRAISGVYGTNDGPAMITDDAGKCEDVVDIDPHDDDTDDQPDSQQDDIPFEDRDQHEKVAILKDLAKRKGYDTDSLPTSVDEMDDRNLVRFYQHLFSMADATGIDAEDDIPF
jgi:hypothetical protein